MQIAEKLYNNGYISYPRTETDRYAHNFDFEALISKLEGDRWVGDCINLFRQQGLQRPRAGKNDDKAHPPIHPLRPGNELSGDEARVFEYIVRRFVAGVAKDAVIHETHIICNVGMEQFSIKGDMIVEENYLRVFTYDRLSTKELPRVNQGQRLAIKAIKKRDGQTTAPLTLSESDLINIMDKNGIGTDATIHEHIQKVLDRGYAVKSNDRFIPTALGVGLVIGYDMISSEFSLTKSKLRADLEKNLQMICDSNIASSSVISSHLGFFNNILESTAAKMDYVYGSVDFYANNSQLNLPIPEAGHGPTAENNNGPSSKRKRAAGQSARGRARRGKGIAARTHQSSRSLPVSESSTDIRCECNLIAVQLVSKREGSAGRRFLTCGKKVYKCKFFQWLDN